MKRFINEIEKLTLKQINIEYAVRKAYQVSGGGYNDNVEIIGMVGSIAEQYGMKIKKSEKKQ